MKRLAALALLAAFGCSNGKDSVYPLEESHPKRCRADSECRIAYNVSYRGFCDSGCFNTGTLPAAECSKEPRSEFPEGLGCACASGVCSLRAK